MLPRVIDWSIRNKFLVILATVFLALAGVYAVRQTPLDAIPDLSDVQVIVYTEYPGQAPQVVEDQVTYPITTQMLAVPSARVVRGYSFFGFSFVYVIFEDGTDLYWARSRVLEYLNYVGGKLPRGVTPSLGPDATGVGWAFMYVLQSPERNLAELRSLQDWYLKYQLTGVPGVSEVASVGGFIKQYQITVDPNKLRAYHLSLAQIRSAVQRSNNDVGGRVIEMAESEFMVRGKGYIRDVADIDSVALGVDPSGTPILLRDVGDVQVGPEIRRGLAELDGRGETVGGIVIVRSGANAHDVIRRVKDKLAEIRPGLPEDVQILIAYDRSGLIERSVSTLEEKLVEESIVVALVCLVFLLHVRSALVAIFTLPIAVLMAFVLMDYQGIDANVMSLGGIAIAVGAMVDAAIVMIENAHKHLERDAGRKEHWEIIADAAKEVGPTLFYALLVITVSFMPVFALEAQEGRLFKPLAFTKTYSMAAASLLSVTLVPVLMGYWIRGRIRPETRNPVNRIIISLYRPVVHLVLRWRWAVLALTVAALGMTWIPVLAARLRIHAPAVGGRPPVHADDAPGRVDRQSARSPPADGQDHPVVPGGRSRLRQGRPGGHGDRSRAAQHGRNHHHAEAAVGLARRNDPRTADPRDESGDPDPRGHQRLDDADQDTHRHAVDGHQDPGGDQGLRAGPRRARPSRPADRSSCQDRPGHAVGLRRARDGRQLPELPDRSERDRALRPHGERRRGRHPVGHRRHEHHHDGGRSRTVSGQPALQSRAPRQRAGAARDRRLGAGRAAGPARAAHPRGGRERPSGDQDRKRPTQRLDLRGPRRGGRGDVRAQRAAGGRERRAGAAGLQPRLERPVPGT